MDLFTYLFCPVFAMFCVRLFICALWSPAGKGQTRSTCITPEQSTFYGSPARTCQNIIFQNVIYSKKFRIEKY